MDIEKLTTISIGLKTKNKLDRLKLCSAESYENMLNRVLTEDVIKSFEEKKDAILNSRFKFAWEIEDGP